MQLGLKFHILFGTLTAMALGICWNESESAKSFFCTLSLFIGFFSPISLFVIYDKIYHPTKSFPTWLAILVLSLMFALPFPLAFLVGVCFE